MPWAALFFGVACAGAGGLAGLPAGVSWWLALPAALSLLGAVRFGRRAGLATLAGGWALTALALLALLAVLALLRVPLWISTALMALGCVTLVAVRTERPSSQAESHPGLFFLLLILALPPLALWGESLWSAPAGLASGGAQRIWQDWYFHGVLVDMLADSVRHAPHDLRGVGLPPAPYHYLSYGLVAWLAAVTDGRGLDGVLLLWWPLGMFLLLAAASEWVCRLRPGQPWLAVILPLTLFWPDASGLGSGQHFLGWHWLQMISPGSLYGAAAALLLASWLSGRCMASDAAARVRTLLVLLLALAAAMLFKAQIVLLAGPLLIFWWAGNQPAPARQRLVWLTVFTVIALSILLWLPLPGLPLIHLGGGGWREYWPALLHLQDRGWLETLQATAWAPVVILAGTLGGMLVGVLAWPRAPRAVRWWMLLVLGGYLLYALGLDPDTRGGAGTPEELQHRPLVWVLPMWWMSTAPFLLPAGVGRSGRSGGVLAALALAVACMAGIMLGPQVQRGPEKIDGRPAVPQGLAEAAAFIRQHAQPGDVCQAADADPRFQLPALAACTPYWVGFNLHSRSSAAVRGRADEWLRLRALPPTERLEALRKAGIRWYSAGPVPAENAAAYLPDDPRLPLAPAFQSGDAYVVYQLLP